MRTTVGDPPDGGTFTGRARRAQILACAVEALAEVGYARTSVAEIARRAGVSKGVVAYHFRSKDELLTQVVADVYATAGTEIQARVAAASSPAAALRGYVEANLAFIHTHPTQIRAVAEIASNLRGPGGALQFGSGADPVADHLEQLLAAGQERGALRRFNARAMAVVIRAAIDAASGRLLADPSFDLDAYRGELLRIVDLATRSDP